MGSRKNLARIYGWGKKILREFVGMESKKIWDVKWRWDKNTNTLKTTLGIYCPKPKTIKEDTKKDAVVYNNCDSDVDKDEEGNPTRKMIKIGYSTD